mmetsp:Transcript_26834/g.44198  ORF Transcript_26834/g.44198 Transcript_26834/m.44198 type:complete len:134 (-) Transcript_26834:239-640(-)
MRIGISFVQGWPNSLTMKFHLEIWNHEKFKSSRPLVLEICRLLREKNKQSQPSTQSSNSSSSVPGSQYSNPAPANSAPLAANQATTNDAESLGITDDEMETLQIIRQIQHFKQRLLKWTGRAALLVSLLISIL